MAFYVPNVEVAILALKERGVVCDPVRHDPFTNNNLTFFRDPEGNVFELHE